MTISCKAGFHRKKVGINIKFPRQVGSIETSKTRRTHLSKPVAGKPWSHFTTFVSRPDSKTSVNMDAILLARLFLKM